MFGKTKTFLTKVEWKKMKISSSLLFGWFEKLEKNCLFVSHDSTIKRKKEEAKWVKKCKKEKSYYWLCILKFKCDIFLFFKKEMNYHKRGVKIKEMGCDLNNFFFFQNVNDIEIKPSFPCQNLAMVSNPAPPKPLATPSIMFPALTSPSVKSRNPICSFHLGPNGQCHLRFPTF